MYVVVFGKGGVGKFIVMVNLVVVMVVCGLLIGVLDVDIYGYFIFWMMGIIDWFI